MDPLSDVLRAVRLDGAFFYTVEAAHPWGVFVADAHERVPRVLPGAEHLISYHIVTSGSCWGGVDAESQVLLEPGDVIVFPHGDGHLLSSEEGNRLDPSIYTSAPTRPLETLRLGDTRNGARRVTFVCGFLGCDARPYNPLLAALPRCMHIPGGVSGWLAEFPRQVVIESRNARAGGATILTRMAELLFVDVVRRYMDGLNVQETGWLAGLRDSIVGPALTELHRRPSHPWTLVELAHAVSTSRTVLTERFVQLVGIPPMQYLTQWRLQLAAKELASGSEKVATIGARVGYESEAAFSRAFKRATGQAPASWRRVRQNG
jgi:AraC-like DNA-binding protein